MSALKIMKNKKGAIAVTFAILLATLLGATGLGVEVGKWYLIKAEISKAADAAALIGAKSISNLNLTEEEKKTLMQDLAKQNFPPGYLGTPKEGESGAVSFTAAIDELQAQAAGRVSTGTIFAKLFGVDKISPGKTSVAGVELAPLEIFLTRDLTGCGSTCRSSWIEGSKKVANAFENYQDRVKIGYMVCRGAMAGVVYPLQTDFLKNPYTSPYTGKTYANILEAIDDNSAISGNDATVSDVMFDLAREYNPANAAGEFIDPSGSQPIMVNGEQIHGFTAEETKKYFVFTLGYAENGFTDCFTRNGTTYYGAYNSFSGGINHPYTGAGVVSPNPYGDAKDASPYYVMSPVHRSAPKASAQEWCNNNAVIPETHTECVGCDSTACCFYGKGAWDAEPGQNYWGCVPTYDGEPAEFVPTTKWHIFEKWKDDTDIPYAQTFYDESQGCSACDLNKKINCWPPGSDPLSTKWYSYIWGVSGGLDGIAVVQKEAVESANELKDLYVDDRRVKIFAIGGSNHWMLANIATDSNCLYDSGSAFNCSPIVGYYEDIIDKIKAECVDPTKIRLLR